MSNPQFRTRRSAVARAVAEREQGRKRLSSATAAVSVASLAAAGVVTVLLPGASHAATNTSKAPAAKTPVRPVSPQAKPTARPSTSPHRSTSSGSSGSSSSSSGSSGSGSSSSSSGSSSSSSSQIQAPTSAPVQSSAPVSTSGGS